MSALHLEWQGPFSLATNEGRQGFVPPATGGVYLWCVGRAPRFRIAYVGEASSLSIRMYGHMISMLGGAYELYTDAHLLDGECPIAAYQPGIANLVTNFVGDFATHSAMAYQNLLKYTFFWAVVPGDRAVRRGVESALIQASRDTGEPLQNSRTSINESSCSKVVVTSSFRAGIILNSIAGRLEYGIDQMGQI